MPASLITCAQRLSSASIKRRNSSGVFGARRAVRELGFGKRCTLDADLDVENVGRQRGGVDFHAQSRRLGQADLAVRAGQQVVLRDREPERLGLGGILANLVPREPRIGLDRRGERAVRGEGVIDIGDACCRRVVRPCLRHRDAADPAGIDLHVAEAGAADRVVVHGCAPRIGSAFRIPGICSPAGRHPSSAASGTMK